MLKTIIAFIGSLYFVNALIMWFTPLYWHETVPGIVEMGPFNMHFIRDIGLVYGTMGAGLIWVYKNTSVAMFASIWPALHAVYHIMIFFQRGAPIDMIAATNLFLIQIPAWLAVWAIWRAQNSASAN